MSHTTALPGRAATLAAALWVAPFFGMELAAQGTPAEARLLELHEATLEAHRTGDVDLWMSVEADTVISVNRGDISFPPAGARRRVRAAYLESATFDLYEDVRLPLVTVSEDGSLGWLIAQVRIQGHRTAADGAAVPIDDVWAWIELYRRMDGEWSMVGNVSNRRPPDEGLPGS